MFNQHVLKAVKKQISGHDQKEIKLTEAVIFSLPVSDIGYYQVLYVRNTDAIKKHAGRDNNIYYNIVCSDYCSIDSEVIALNYIT